ncbi:MAG: hypothetical protein H8E44_17745 [Planctomycetes bacterium]|nr:hypothetical protein [Planctomycetota bacterium]
MSRWRTMTFVGMLVALVTMPICGVDGLAGEIVVNTGDRFELAVSSSGALTEVSMDGRELPRGGRGEFFPISICDVTKHAEFVPVAGKTLVENDGAVVHRAELADLSLDVTGRFEATDELISVKLSVQDTSGKDRGLLVRFALPIQAEGWRWWDDVDATRAIGTTGTYENSRRIREFAALPEWHDQPALDMGAHSVNFCNVITGPVGLCYAVPLDQPRIFRTGYDAEQGLFYIVYDVALAKETEPPSAAELTFHVYRCDPDWGMRSALDRYYRLFPQFFAKHVTKEGMWMAFSKLSEVDNVNEFRFALQEGAPEPGYDDRLDVDSLTYFTHAGLFANIADYNPETDPEPSYERQLDAVREKFRQQTGSAETFDASGLHDRQGRLSVKRTSVYGHVIAQYNLDAQLPYGEYMLGRIPGVFRSYRERRGGELDGFYYDGITTGINYRRDHFRYAEYPPIWDPVQERPFLYNYFSSVEFAKEVAKRLHAQGKITMMNGAMGSSFYTAPYLDVMGSETGLRINRGSFNYIRTICRQKPFVTLLKGNFSELTEADMALFMKRCVAYGVFPGVFDWPPSGLGPGSRYWDHAEWYERDRGNHRLYQTLCQQLARAGWEPLTLARSRNPHLALERFGTASDGEIFFTVLNDAAGVAESVVSIPVEALPDDPVVVDEATLRWLPDASREKGSGTFCAKHPSGRSGKRSLTPFSGLDVPLRLEPESLAVLHVTSKKQLAQTHIDEILRNLSLRNEMRKIDVERPESSVHWRKTRYGAYERDNVDDKSCLKLANASSSQTKGAMQWVMLYQQEAEPLKLRLRLKCDQVTPDNQGSLHVDAVLCHVNMKTRFTERKREKYELDTGTYDWRDVEIIIKPERPLRSIQLSPYLWRCSGTVWIDEVSITPVAQPDHQYVVDPTMDQWYEQPSAGCVKEMDARFARLETDISKLKESDVDAFAGSALAIVNAASTHRQWIQESKLDNPCRRELRELEDLSARLSLVCSTLMGVHGPYVDVPTVAVPGEEMSVRVRVIGTEESNLRYAIQTPSDWHCQAVAGGHFKITVPQDALGTTARLTATATVGSPTGPVLSLQKTTEVRVVPALEATMRLGGVSASGEQFRFLVDATNNSQTPMEVSLRTKLPQNWQLVAPGEVWPVEAKTTNRIPFCVTPSKETKPGRYEIRAEVAMQASKTPLAFSRSVYFVPGSLNLLANPGFELESATRWSKNEGSLEIDAKQFHGGRQSLKLSNKSPSLRSGASQTITLNQKTPQSIFVRGHAKADGVSGHAGTGFSVYVDIYYTDGTPLYGHTINWQTGTTDWQYGEMTIGPAKPIRNVNVYLLLRGHSGTAWFDDLFVAETPFQ